MTTGVRGGEDGSFLKKFLDRSAIFDFIVMGVLALDAYLLQRSGTFSSSNITEFPPGSIEIAAAQATALLIVAKLINGYLDSGDH